MLAGTTVLALMAGTAGFRAMDAVHAQPMPWQAEKPAEGAATVQFVGPRQAEFAADQPQTVNLRFSIQSGYHINSHTPHDKTLIPTRLMVVDGDGITVSGVDFPPGIDTAFPFAPKERMSVYTGSLMLPVHVKVARGSHLLQGVLRYQACDVNACMPPHNAPVAVSLIAR
jgi:hypothetical protein